MNDINSASIIVEIKHLLSQDIEVLTNIRLNPLDSDALQNTINSLIECKKHIISLLPENAVEFIRGVHPPQSDSFPKYSSSDSQLSHKSEMLVTAFLEIENQQQDYITTALKGSGLPEYLEITLSKVLSVYHKITSQLKRMTNTHQLNAIIVN